MDSRLRGNDGPGGLPALDIIVSGCERLNDDRYCSIQRISRHRLISSAFASQMAFEQQEMGDRKQLAGQPRMDGKPGFDGRAALADPRKGDVGKVGAAFGLQSGADECAVDLEVKVAYRIVRADTGP